MEHSEAVRLHAAEKYLLGELSEAQREEYEEHYFDCFACAEELKTTVTFMESAKQVARQTVPVRVEREVLQPAAVPPRASPHGGFWAWLRPAFAVPAFATAILLMVVGYQNGVTIPRLKQSQARAVSASFYKPFSLPALGTRGASKAFTVSIRPTEAFTLDVDMPGDSASGYFVRIQDQSGNVHLAQPVSPEEARNAVHLLFPAGSLQSGQYTLFVFKGQTAAGGSSAAVASEAFIVEFLS